MGPSAVKTYLVKSGRWAAIERSSNQITVGEESHRKMKVAGEAEQGAALAGISLRFIPASEL